MTKSTLVVAGAFAVLLASCASPTTTATTVAAAAPATPDTAPTAETTSPPTTTPPATEGPTTVVPPTTVPVAPMEITGGTVVVRWDALAATPFYAPAVGGSDPFFHIHTNPDTDGFFLSFEMYTTGYGQQWTGETGTFEISCADPVTSTGICPYFDPDGPGPEPVKGDDFAATGLLTIVRLDDTGYEIIVHELAFSDGTTFAAFEMTG